MFQLMQDEDTGRRYWYGSEDGWKDGTEIGWDGIVTLDAEGFVVGTVIFVHEPSESTDRVAAKFNSKLIAQSLKVQAQNTALECRLKEIAAILHSWPSSEWGYREHQIDDILTRAGCST